VTQKTEKNNFITFWAEDTIRTAYYILGPWCDEIIFCCFIYVAQWWALHVVVKRQFFFYIFLLKTNRKSYAPYRMVTLPIS